MESVEQVTRWISTSYVVQNGMNSLQAMSQSLTSVSVTSCGGRPEGVTKHAPRAVLKIRPLSSLRSLDPPLVAGTNEAIAPGVPQCFQIGQATTRRLKQNSRSYISLFTLGQARAKFRKCQEKRISSPLPLPIGLWGPRLMVETGPAYPLGRGHQGGRSGRQGQGRPRIAKPNAGIFHDLVDRLSSATQTARVAVTVR
jgi:hypothetical protein